MSTNDFPAHFIDQLGNKLYLPQSPRRIVSLVPSQTELLFDLGLDARIVGTTKFCIHPKEKVQLKRKIGGTKNFKLDTIHLLRPDLIIGNKEENYPEGIAALQQVYPVWLSNIATLADALAMIAALGLITLQEEKAAQITQTIQSAFQNLPKFTPIPTAYFIWKKPYMSVGADTFIHQMMQLAGFQNVFVSLPRYPVITPEMLQIANPNLILLSSEPYPFKEKHLVEFKSICPEAAVIVVDGELFSWYGSRLQHAPAYFSGLREAISKLLRD